MDHEEYVILVDENDQEIGVEKKLVAHQQAKLHRAFSVFVLREQSNKQQLLLQQRQTNKYHSAGLWTNTCCSHPAPGETVLMGAQRRLMEEMGMHVKLREIGYFRYRATVGAGLIEHEIDHVLIGMATPQEIVKVNPEEVVDYQWIDITRLQEDLHKNPQKYTAWLAQALGLVLDELK